MKVQRGLHTLFADDAVNFNYGSRRSIINILSTIGEMYYFFLIHSHVSLPFFIQAGY